MRQSGRDHAIQRLMWLRARTPPPPVPAAGDVWGALRAEHRQSAARAARALARDDDGSGVITGGDREDVATWLAEVSGWWTPPEWLAALDDLTAGLDLDQVLRICEEEGFRQVGEHELDGDRFIFLLDGDGLFAVVFLARERTGPARPWSVAIYGNVLVEDTGLFTASYASRMGRRADDVRPDADSSDGRWIAAGGLGWHLRYAPYAGGSLRATVAAIRATSSPVIPWRHPPIATWFGPDAPRGLERAPHEEIARVARANTAAALDVLPEHVHAALGPRLMHA